MNRTLLILAILYEIIAAVLIYRLWARKSRPGIVERCLLSVVLLIPFFGWLFYGFLGSSPDKHGEDVGTHSCGDGVGDTGHH